MKLKNVMVYRFKIPKIRNSKPFRSVLWLCYWLKDNFRTVNFNRALVKINWVIFLSVPCTSFIRFYTTRTRGAWIQTWRCDHRYRPHGSTLVAWRNRKQARIVPVHLRHPISLLGLYIVNMIMILVLSLYFLLIFT